MKVIFFALVLSFASYSQIYSGEFSEIHSSGGICDQIFQVSQYNANFILTGMGGTTAVLNYQNKNKTGFLHGLTQFGLYGVMGDFKVEKSFPKGENQIFVEAEGLVDRKFLAFTQKISIESPSGQAICSASAGFSSFN